MEKCILTECQDAIYSNGVCLKHWRHYRLSTQGASEFTVHPNGTVTYPIPENVRDCPNADEEIICPDCHEWTSVCEPCCNGAMSDDCTCYQ